MTPTLPAIDEKPFTPPYPVSFPTNLPYDDGEPMDSPWHRDQMFLSIELLETNWKGRRFYCGGNMFVYFSIEQVRNRDFRGPDFFAVLNVDHDKPRQYWAIWDEGGRFPDFILELLSPTTLKDDLVTKKEIYEQTFRTPEYICYDPDADTLQGWRLDKRYRPIPLESGRLWLETLELWIGRWKGTYLGKDAIWLRFFDREGKMLPTAGEAEAARAEAEAARAESEAARAEAEATRATKAEEETERLRKEVETLRQQLQQPKS